jgi:hypothetical protein
VPQNTIRARLHENRDSTDVSRILRYWIDGREETAIEWHLTGNEGALPGALGPHDIAATALVFYAMHIGAPLHVEGPVSRSLLERLEDFVAVWSTWRPDLYRRIEVTAAEEVSGATNVPRKAVMAFSGGVDASFTAWRHAQGQVGRRGREIQAAMLIHGLVDIPLDRPEAYEQAVRSAQTSLASLRVPLVRLRTNWVERLCINWGMEFGAGIATCLRNWQGVVDTALIASDEDYRHLVTPWGSNPISNAMLSSQDFTVVYDAAEFTRSQKLQSLTAWPEGLSNLRVCWDSGSGTNCGRCEKCLRTKMNILAVGGTPPPSLAGTPSAADVLKLRAQNRIQLAYLQEIAEFATRQHVTDPWVRALRTSIRKNRLLLTVERPKWIARKLMQRVGGAPLASASMMPAARRLAAMR